MPAVAEEAVLPVFVNKADREMHEDLVQRLAGNQPKTGKRKGGRKK
jgi:hypothetical protein